MSNSYPLNLLVQTVEWIYHLLVIGMPCGWVIIVVRDVVRYKMLGAISFSFLIAIGIGLRFQ